MLKIGEFSRLSQVTVKALHHYDQLGLLKPAETDKFTGYRYYTVDQLARIHRIVALKEMGLSLEQIAVLLDDNLSTEQMYGMLHMKQAEMRQQLRETQARLAQVEFRLRMIEMEEDMPDLEVVVKQTPPIRALTIRMTVERREELIAFGVELEHAFVQRGIRLTAPATEIHRVEEFQYSFNDVELVFPVDESQTEDVPLATKGTLKLATVPGLSMAATHIHRGIDREEMSEAMAVLQRWIVDSGYRLCGKHHVVRHHGPLEHAEYVDWISEIQHEIALAE